MVSNSYNYAIILLEDVRQFHILIILKKMQRFIQILTRFLNILNLFHSSLKNNFYLLINYLFHSHSKDQSGLC